MNKLLVILALVIGCGPTAREQAIRTTLVTANVAEVAFVQFDREVQAKLVAAATDEAGGEAALHDWRRKRGEAEDLLVGLYRAIAIAATFNNDQSLQAMLTALAIARQQLAAMGVTL